MTFSEERGCLQFPSLLPDKDEIAKSLFFKGGSEHIKKIYEFKHRPWVASSLSWIKL